MLKKKITPPGWNDVEEGQQVVFFEGKKRRVDLWSGRAWANGVIYSFMVYIGLTILSLILIYIRN